MTSPPGASGWRDAPTSAEMITRYVAEAGYSGSKALASFGERLGVAGVRPDNTVRRWITSGRCEIPAGLMLRALRDLENERAGKAA